MTLSLQIISHNCFELSLWIQRFDGQNSNHIQVLEYCSDNIMCANLLIWLRINTSFLEYLSICLCTFALALFKGDKVVGLFK